jgi:hypothetical protein
MENIQTIQDILLKHIKKGFTIDDDTLHFIESTHGKSLDEIHDFLLKTEDELIYNIIIYPDENLRTEIEGIIPDSGIGEEDVNLIKKNILASTVEIKIICYDKIIIVPAAKVQQSLSNYIEKLRLRKNLEFITKELEVIDKDILYKFRSIFRNKFTAIDTDKTIFLCNIITKSIKREEQIKDIINTIEKIYDIIKDEKGDILDILSYQKDYYESIILQHENFSKLSKSYGMDFMMSQKIQPPVESAEMAAYYIGIINKVTFLVYGIIIPGQSARDVILSEEDFIKELY